MFRITRTLIIILMMVIIIILKMIILIIFGIVFIIFGGRLMQDRDSALDPGQWKAEECEFAFFRLLFLKSSVMFHQGRLVARRKQSNFNSVSNCLFHLQVIYVLQHSVLQNRGTFTTKYCSFLKAMCLECLEWNHQDYRGVICEPLLALSALWPKLPFWMALGWHWLALKTSWIDKVWEIWHLWKRPIKHRVLIL